MKKHLLAIFISVLFISNIFAIEIVRINGGTFMLGSPVTEAKRMGNEGQREVSVSSFYIGKYEVTQAQYAEIMGANPSHNKGSATAHAHLFAHHPVEQVSWFDAVLFCNKLSEKENLTPVYTINGNTVTWNRSANGYRLPTEAEWEYACRAGTTTPFNTGNNIMAEHANFDATRPYDDKDPGDYRRDTLPVGSFAPNAFGLYDMHGNVGEWCWDIYGDAYPMDQKIDPTGVSSGGYRVFRGGGWNHSADFVRSAKRMANVPVTKGHYLGFRVARNAN